MSVRESIDFFSTLELTENEKTISSQILKEIMSRLSFLDRVGLGYLTLFRYAQTLSGREPENQACHPDRKCSLWRSLCARRAVYRTSSA